MAEQCFAFPPPAESGFVTIGTNAGGDYFLLSLDSGEVFYWDHELHDELIDRDEVVWLAPSLPALVEGLSSTPACEPEAVD
jgi:hypothetical protein